MNLSTVSDLICFYRAVKTIHGEEVSPSIEEKLSSLMTIYSNTPADSNGVRLAKMANDAWGHLAPGTVKRLLVQLRAVYRCAEKAGVISKAPHIEVPFVHDTVYVDVSTKEIDRLLDFISWVEPHWYPLSLLLSHTGARLGEALRVNESSFMPRGTRIVKPTRRRSKTIDRVVPYTSRMRSAVDRGLFSCGLVPEGIADKSVPECFGRVLDKATGALSLPTLRVHDLRHAFASIIAEQGGDLADISTALGQSSPAMAMRYRGLVRGRLDSILGAV